MLLTANVWRSTSASYPMRFVPDTDEWLNRRAQNWFDPAGEWTMLGGQMLVAPTMDGGVPLWVVATHYAVGALTRDPAGTLWTNKVDHTSGSGTFVADRAANPTYWVQTPNTTATFVYLDKNCVALKSGGFGDSFTDDADSFRLDERLLKLGMVWQWKANKGTSYAEDMGTYSDALGGSDGPRPAGADYRRKASDLGQRPRLLPVPGTDAMNQATYRGFRRAAVPPQVAQQLQTVTLPAPTRGLVLNENESFMQPGGAIVLDNWKPTMKGLAIRGGSKTWASLPETTSVISMFQYISGINTQFMFAGNATKLYNVTSATAGAGQERPDLGQLRCEPAGEPVRRPHAGLQRGRRLCDALRRHDVDHVQFEPDPHRPGADAAAELPERPQPDLCVEVPRPLLLHRRRVDECVVLAGQQLPRPADHDPARRRRDERR
jgi:hypothetical protein